MGLNAAVAGAAEHGGYIVVLGDYDAAKGQSRRRRQAPTMPSFASRSRTRGR